MFTPVLLPNIREKYSGEERHHRARKAAKYVFKLAYFIIANIAGFFVLRDAKFTPPSLFGRGDASYTFELYPETPSVPYLKEYYLFTLGYHFESFMALLFNPPANDFGEMFFHHLLTVTLILSSYFENYLAVGALVLFVHDWQDLLISFIRIIVDLSCASSALVLPIFLGILVSWIWGRCLAFPYDVVYRGTFLSG